MGAQKSLFDAIVAFELARKLAGHRYLVTESQQKTLAKLRSKPDEAMFEAYRSAILFQEFGRFGRLMDALPIELQRFSAQDKHISFTLGQLTVYVDAGFVPRGAYGPWGVDLSIEGDMLDLKDEKAMAIALAIEFSPSYYAGHEYLLETLGRHTTIQVYKRWRQRFPE